MPYAFKRDRDEWRKRNKERLRQYNRAYKRGPRNKPSEKVTSRKQARINARRRADPAFARKKRIGIASWRALKGREFPKDVELFLGYSATQLRNRVQETFQAWMTWENHGQWHLDHIVPLAIWDLSNDAEMKAAWWLSNLRALPAKDNIRKARNLDESFLEGCNGKAIHRYREMA